MSFDLASVRERLPSRQIEWFDTVDSTMREAARLAERHAAHGTVIGAEEQTAGMGRLGRSWVSERESGLYFTVILHLNIPAATLSMVTLALGLAAADAITKVTGLACDLRWPNDVLIGERKCAGILVQMHEGALLAGIGVNVNQEAFPDELVPIATSLKREAGRAFAREALLCELLESIDSFCGLLRNAGPDPILQLFCRSSSYVYGRRVIVEQGEGALWGTTAGLNPNGFLVLRQDDGTEHLIIAGGVRPA